MKYLFTISVFSILTYGTGNAQAISQFEKKDPQLLKPIEQTPNKEERIENKASNQIEQSNKPQILRAEEAVQDPNAAPQNAVIVPPPAVLNPPKNNEVSNEASQLKTEKTENTKPKTTKKNKGRSRKN